LSGIRVVIVDHEPEIGFVARAVKDAAGTPIGIITACEAGK
jgi:hypothetical protein